MVRVTWMGWLAVAALLAGCWESGGRGAGDSGMDTPTDGDTAFSCGLSDMPDVHGSSASNVWAVGEGGCALHWDGEEWSAEEVLASSLRAVWAVSDDLAFAAGGDGVWRRTADGWANDFAPPNTDFTDIWADSEDFAVAVGVDVGSGSGLIAVRGAEGWSFATSLDVPPLSSVWGEGPDAVWVGGEDGTLLRFDGAEWSAEETYCEGDCDISSIVGRGGGELWFVASDAGEGGRLGHRTVDGEGNPVFTYGDCWTDGSFFCYGDVWTAPGEDVLAVVDVVNWESFIIGKMAPPA